MLRAFFLKLIFIGKKKAKKKFIEKRGNWEKRKSKWNKNNKGNNNGEGRKTKGNNGKYNIITLYLHFLAEKKSSNKGTDKYKKGKDFFKINILEKIGKTSNWKK